MSPDTLNRCPECSARITESSPASPCPACLLRLGMQSWQASHSLQQFRLEPTIDSRNQEPALAVSVEELAAKFPQFELLHLVGSGGMGSVYCARQKSLNRLVALKIIKPEAKQRAEFADRFVREARALAQLNHPNIITVHDFGEIDGIYYFVMEYLDGVNLRQMLRGNRLTPRQALEIVPAVCDALQYAHDKGIVHRDIKPENILIDTQGGIKIADFGLAKLLDQESAGPQLTQANHIMGTMHYMAPEQIEQPLQVDHRADIYSLGVVIYELLTGELPLGRFAPPSQKVSIDIRLDEIVMQTLAKEPALRYQRVSDVKAQLSSLTSSVSKVAQAESPIPAISPHAPAETGKPTPATGRDRVGHWPGPMPDCGWIAGLMHPQTWLNALYLILSLPLGILYFVFIVTGLSLGLGTLVVWLGIPVLLLLFLGVRGCLAFERSIMRQLLREDIPVQRDSAKARSESSWERVKELAFSGETWKGILYLTSKLPLGILSFTLAIVGLTVPLSMVLAPVSVVLFDSAMNIPGVAIDGYPLAAMFSVIGVALFPLATRGISYVACLNAAWARFWLTRR